MKVPTFPINVVFFLVFIVNIIYVIYDLEVSREMQASASFGHLIAYIFGVKSLYDSKVDSNGIKTESRAMQVLFDAMGRSITHWIFLISFIIGTAGCFVVLLLISRK